MRLPLMNSLALSLALLPPERDPLTDARRAFASDREPRRLGPLLIPESVADRLPEIPDGVQVVCRPPYADFLSSVGQGLAEIKALPRPRRRHTDPARKARRKAQAAARRKGR